MKEIRNNKKVSKKAVIGPASFLVGILLGSTAMVGAFVYLEDQRSSISFLGWLNLAGFRIVECIAGTVSGTIVMLVFMLVLTLIRRKARKRLQQQ
jgi:Ca2+/Na+ antiporter